MLRLVLIVLPALAVAATAGYIAGTHGLQEAPIEAPATAEASDEPPAAVEGGEPSSEAMVVGSTGEAERGPRQAEVPFPPRNVTPPGVYTGPVRSYEPLPHLEPEDEPLEASRTFHRVVVEAAGTIQAGDTRIQLAGITAPSPDQTCTDASDREWPCGQAATTALRLLVRSRAIECDILGTNGDEIIGDCRVGSRPLSAWLVEQGWAEPDDGQYEEAAATARAGERGMFAPARVDRAAPANWPSPADEAGQPQPVATD